VRGQHGLEERELVAAGHAARPPEVDDHRPAAQRRKREGPAIERQSSDLRDRLALGDGRRVGRVDTVDGGAKLDQREGREGRDDEAEDDEPAPPVELGRRDRAYWTFKVPVIWSMGWIEQMNT
jgi:hypothetical protein